MSENENKKKEYSKPEIEVIELDDDLEDFEFSELLAYAS
jgi:hypothetical protein